MLRQNTHRHSTHEHLIDCFAHIARTALSNTHAPATSCDGLLVNRGG
jgi:hypothetical protein